MDLLALGLYVFCDIGLHIVQPGLGNLLSRTTAFYWKLFYD